MSSLKRTTDVRKSPLQQWDVSWPLSSPTFHLVQDVSWPLSSPTFHLVQDVSWPLSSPTFHLVQDVSWPLSSTVLRPTSERITAGHTASPTFHLVQFGHDRFTHGLHLLSLVIKLLLLSQVDGIQPGDHLIEIVANGFNVAQNVARISTSRKKTSCYALT